MERVFRYVREEHDNQVIVNVRCFADWQVKSWDFTSTNGEPIAGPLKLVAEDFDFIEREKRKLVYRHLPVLRVSPSVDADREALPASAIMRELDDLLRRAELLEERARSCLGGALRSDACDVVRKLHASANSLKFLEQRLHELGMQLG